MKLSKEFKKISAKKLKNNIFITKILEILKIMVGQDRIMDEYYSCFDKKLEELFGYFDKCNEIDFEEALIEILNEIIKRINFLIDIYELIQKNLKPIFLKNDKDIKIFFETFYLFSKYGKEFIVFNKLDLLKDVFYFILVGVFHKLF